MLRWYKPESELESLGMDEENDCEKVKYTVEKEYNIEGASNGYYVNYVMYCVDNGDLIYREHSGSVIPVDPEEKRETNVTRFYLKSTDLSPNFKGVSFDIKYKMAEE
jgi:hypothetical protein